VDQAEPGAHRFHIGRGYLRSKKIAIAVVNTFDQAYYENADPTLPSNPSNVLFQKIGAVLAPADPPLALP
jgi:hypothetical protein